MIVTRRTPPTWAKCLLLSAIPVVLLVALATGHDRPAVLPDDAPCPRDAPVLPSGCLMPPVHTARYWVLPSGQLYGTEGDYAPPQGAVPTELPNATDRTP